MAYGGPIAVQSCAKTRDDIFDRQSTQWAAQNMCTGHRLSTSLVDLRALRGILACKERK